MSSASSSPNNTAAPSQSKQSSPHDHSQQIPVDASNKETSGHNITVDLRHSFSDSEFGSLADSVELQEDHAAATATAVDEGRKGDLTSKNTSSLKGSDKVPSTIVESTKTRQQLAAMITSSDKKTGYLKS